MRQPTRDFIPLTPRWYDLRITLGRLFLHHPATRYGSALAIVVLTTLVCTVLPIHLELETLQLLYVLVVLVSAVISGFGPAILAATLSFMCLNFFFVVPRYTLQVARPEDLLRLGEFWVVALLSGALAAYARHQTDQAERRVLEISTLHTLTRAIEAESTIQGRLDQIAQTTATLLELPFCAVTLLAPTCAATWGARVEATHWIDIPISHDDSVVGRLQAGLPAPRRRFTAAEHHLLRLITTQLISVLERARMLDAAAQTRALQESDRLKSAILSSLSHDLRTPLTTIQGAVSELKATDVAWTPAAQAQLLDAIDDQAQRLRRVVGNLLDLSKLRAGALLPHTDWYALDEIVYHALDSLHDMLAGHAVTVQSPVDLPLTRLDFVLTEQVITNLVQNAVQYGAPSTPIAIILTTTATLLHCHVRNTGQPIAPEWHERLFEPFVRGIGDSAPVPGSGLGLAICKGFVEAQGGTIQIEPAITDGVALTLTFPLQPLERTPND